MNFLCEKFWKTRFFPKKRKLQKSEVISRIVVSYSFCNGEHGHHG